MKLILLVIIGGIFFLIGYKMLSKNKTSKNNFIIGIISLIFLISGYNMLQNKTKNKNLEIILAYNQNRQITCNNITVTQKEFNYVSGTLSFIAKQTSKFKGLSIKIEDCKVD